MTEQISIIVPVYNNAQELPRCLDSILAQEQVNVQILAVNDGSCDASGGILDAYGEKFANIQVIHQENRGVTAARMAGVAAATGAYIGFVDADDTVDPHMYRQLLQNLKESGADIAHCGFRMAFSDGRERCFYNTGAVELHDRTKALQELLSGQRIEPSLCTKLFRRELFSGLQAQMPEDFHSNEDLLMNFLLFSRAKTAIYADFCPYTYQVRADSASRRPLDPGRIWDPIGVRQRILAAAPQSVQTDARRALLATCVNVYNSLVPERYGQWKPDRKRIRGMILQQADQRKLLSRRQRLCAWLIQFAPWLYAPLYRVYAKYFQKNPYL